MDPIGLIFLVIILALILIAIIGPRIERQRQGKE